MTEISVEAIKARYAKDWGTYTDPEHEAMWLQDLWEEQVQWEPAAVAYLLAALNPQRGDQP